MLESRWDPHVAPVPIFFPHPDTIRQIKLFGTLALHERLIEVFPYGIDVPGFEHFRDPGGGDLGR